MRINSDMNEYKSVHQTSNREQMLEMSGMVEWVVLML